MKEKSTSELEKILNTTHPSEIDLYLQENAESIVSSDKPFAAYIRQIIKKKGLMQQVVFIRADISERYGYKLISEQKHTRQRDYILRLCYAAEMTLEETQRALKLYGLSPLYAKIPRDAVLMVAFNQRPSQDITGINLLLTHYGMEPLRPCRHVE
jgi:hypothetical protein